jgi:glycosyltransferase involved in cell wall biosynthesis
MPESAEGAGPYRFPGRSILLVSTNYAPEHAGIGPYATQIAEHWAAPEGGGAAEVHVLTGMPHYPAWRVDPAYRGRWRADETRAGVRLHRRRHTVPPRQTAVKRALFEASVLAGGLVAPPRLGRRPDAVAAQMPSLAGGVLGARLARRWGVPYVPVVQDLMGAAAAQSGITGGDRAAAAASAVEGYALRRATLVGVIHETFVDRVAAMGVDRGRIRLVPNWSHVARPTADRAATRARLGWREGQTVVLHSGNMGLKQGLEVLVEAARLAPEVRFVLMGDGNQRAHLAALAGGIPNLEFAPPAGDGEFPDVLAAADVLAVTQRASVLDMSIPSKLTSYFAAGRPVVASVAGEGGTAEEVRRSGAGVLVEPEDPAALLAAVRSLAADPAAADALGAQGPVYVDAHLSRAAGLARVSALLAEALESYGNTQHGTHHGARRAARAVPAPRTQPTTAGPAGPTADSADSADPQRSAAGGVRGT